MGKVMLGAVMGCFSTAGACLVFGLPGEPLGAAQERELRDTRRAVESLGRDVAGLRSRLEHRPHSAEEDAARRASLGRPVAAEPGRLPPDVIGPQNLPITREMP